MKIGENTDKTAPSLERVLRDNGGRIICACRGSAREVFSCLKQALELGYGFQAKNSGGIENIKIEGRIHEFRNGTIKLSRQQEVCASDGVDEIAKAFE